MYKKDKSISPIICVTNRTLCTVPFMEQLRRIADAGFLRVILREKDLSREAYGRLAKEFLQICGESKAQGTWQVCGESKAQGTLQVCGERKAQGTSQVCGESKTQGTLHTYGETALELHAQALHLSMNNLREWRRAHPRKVFQCLGASVHSVEEAVEARALGADYVTAGHIFATDCKKGLPGRGTGFLGEVVKAVDIPVYAIGGINPGNLKEVKQTGAAGVCIMSSAMLAEEPAALVDELRRIWDETK